MVHAIVILAHFHSLSSFVFGCGVLEDADDPDSPPKTPTLPKDNGARAKGKQLIGLASHSTEFGIFIYLHLPYSVYWQYLWIS